MTILIDGQWFEGHGEAFHSIDPANGERVWEGAAANRRGLHEGSRGGAQGVARVARRAAGNTD